MHAMLDCYGAFFFRKPFQLPHRRLRIRDIHHCTLGMQSSDAIVSKENCDLMHSVQGKADREWATHSGEIAGVDGAKAVQLLAAQMSVPPFPLFSTMLSTIPSLANGATVKLWSEHEPISIASWNVNFSQTRKSRITKVAERMHAPVDTRVAKAVERIFAEKERHLVEIKETKELKKKHTKDTSSGGDGGGAAPIETHVVQNEGAVEAAAGSEHMSDSGNRSPSIFSSCFAGGTFERIMQRASGDCSQVAQSKYIASLPGLPTKRIEARLSDLTPPERAMAAMPGMCGRLSFGQGFVFDEAYKIFEELQLLTDPKKFSKDKSTSGQNVAGAWWNRFLQTGRSDHETKSCGSFGGPAVGAVGSSWTGNLHPTPVIEMCQGLRGEHGGMSKARCFFATGRPVQPHDSVDLAGINVKFEWSVVPDEVAEHVALDFDLHSLSAFQEYFNLQHVAGEDAPGEYVPSEEGILHELPDGVMVGCRMRLVCGRYETEWLLPNRDFEIPDHLKMNNFTQRLTDKTSGYPHLQLTMSQEAAARFRSAQTMFNVRCAHFRTSASPDDASEEGIMPWKLGMLAACLYLWDVMIGVCKPSFKEGWVVEVAHVARAFKLLAIYTNIRLGFKAGIVADADMPARVDYTHQDRNHAGLEKLPGGLWHSEWFRRLFARGKWTADGKHLDIGINDGQKLYNASDVRSKVKVPLSLIRSNFDKVDSCLGAWVVANKMWRLRAVVGEGEEGYQNWSDQLYSLTVWTPSELLKTLRDRRQYQAGHKAKALRPALAEQVSRKRKHDSHASDSE